MLPHCLKKNNAPCFSACSFIDNTHGSFIGRALIACSPPTITQSIFVKSSSPKSSTNGSHDKKPYRSRQITQAVDSVFYTRHLDRNPQPYICRYRPCCEIFCHPLGSFRKNLICVPRCRSDNIRHLIYKFKRHVLMEKVSHRAYENNCWRCSLSRFTEHIFMRCYIKSVFISLYSIFLHL